MRALRPSFLIPVVAFLLLAGVFALHLSEISGGKNISDLPSALIGKAAPKTDLPPVEGGGKGLTSKQIKGKVALINIWASWCPPCRIEHPVLMTLADRGVTIYGINYKDRPEDAVRFLTQLGNPFKQIGVDSSGRTSIDWGVYGYPETFIVDAAGRIRYRHVGQIHPHQLESLILPLLKQAAQPAADAAKAGASKTGTSKTGAAKAGNS